MADPLLVCPEKKAEAPNHVLNPTPLKVSTASSIIKTIQQPLGIRSNIRSGINSQPLLGSALANKDKGSAFKVL